MLIKMDANLFIALPTSESIIGDVIKTGSGERGTKTGNGKMKNENKSEN